MANSDYYLCDICGNKVDKDTRLFVNTEWLPCPASAVTFLLRGKNKTDDHEKGKYLLKWSRDIRSKK